MKVIESIPEFQSLRSSWQEQSVGFVPTMGALHAGHAALVERARNENEKVVVSIFVNPTQFNDPKDLEKYPRTLEVDLELLKGLDVDAVFVPNAQDIYKDQFQYKVLENKDSKMLCGLTRPGHFDGVLTVVLKLFQIAKPSKAYFGEKDYQQLKLIEGMTKAFFLSIEIVPCATIRESDGLAMSSRNVRLSTEQRQKAPLIHKILTESRTREEAQDRLMAQGFKIDYVEEHWNRRFAAVFLGEVRLIDNVPLPTKSAKKDLGQILITAGATREPIDGIRFISNVSTGQTGSRLAELLHNSGWQITFLHGQGSITPNVPCELVEYSSFQNLDAQLKKLLSQQTFQTVIHCAAVSDFSVDRLENRNGSIKNNLESKISSDEDLSIHLRRNYKILPRLKSYSRNPNLKVIGFKLTLNNKPTEQLEFGRSILSKDVDAVVTNDWAQLQTQRSTHEGIVLNQNGSEFKFTNLNELAAQIDKLIQVDLSGDKK